MCPLRGQSLRGALQVKAGVMRAVLVEATGDPNSAHEAPVSPSGDAPVGRADRPDRVRRIAGARGSRFIDPGTQVGLTDVALKDGRPHETAEEMWELHRMRNMLADQIAANAYPDAGEVLDAMRGETHVSGRVLLGCGMVDQVRASLPELGRW